MTSFISAFTLIFFAEMGDKTQLLALAFATKFKMRQVLIGVALGVFLNHGIAILLASFVSQIASTDIIQIAASMLFIVFGLLSMKLDFEDEEEEASEFKFGPVLTVALSFFIGELGDKTQLSAMALGLKSPHPFITLLGTTAGMIAVSLIGIIAGKMLGRKIPEVTMKFIASIIFLGFGIFGMYETLPKEYLTPVNTAIFLLVLSSLVIFILRLNSNNRDKYFARKLNLAISVCRNCEIHDPNCKIGKEIEEIADKYLGTHIPYLGKLVLFMESINKVSPKKYKNLNS